MKIAQTGEELCEEMRAAPRGEPLAARLPERTEPALVAPSPIVPLRGLCAASLWVDGKHLKT